MGCTSSSLAGHTPLSIGKQGRQKHIMSPDLREDVHEGLGVALVACSLKGWRQTQEDTSSIVINLGGKNDMLGVGVFDGHSGPQASRYVAAHIWDQVTKTPEWVEGDVDGALRAGFLNVDANMRAEKVCHGTTAVVAVITPGYMYVANCGDSRAVLCKGGLATALSTDHKPSLYTEKARVLRCGGQVLVGEFGGVARVTAPGAMVAMATSRSLGDFHFKRGHNSEPGEQVVSPSADVTCVRRSHADEFLILGTDGVWDVLDNQEVCDMLAVADRAERPIPPAPPAALPDGCPACSGVESEQRVCCSGLSEDSSPMPARHTSSGSAAFRRSFSLEPTDAYALMPALHRELGTAESLSSPCSATAGEEVSGTGGACNSSLPLTDRAVSRERAANLGDPSGEPNSGCTGGGGGEGFAVDGEGSQRRDRQHGTEEASPKGSVIVTAAADSAAIVGAAAAGVKGTLPPPAGGNGPGDRKQALARSSSFGSGEASNLSSAHSCSGHGVSAENSRCAGMNVPGLASTVPGAGGGARTGEEEGSAAVCRVPLPPLRAVSGESNHYGSGNSWRGGPFGRGSRPAAWLRSHSRRSSRSTIGGALSNGSIRDSERTMVTPIKEMEQSGTMAAARGILDKALAKGSQDNMTLIAVDLRGFADLGSPTPTTPSQ